MPVFDETELAAKRHSPLTSHEKSLSPINQELKEEPEKVTMGLKDLKLKQFEKQQKDFHKTPKEN